MIKGQKHTEETKKVMSKSHKGCVAWNKGISPPLEVREKMRQAHLGVKLSQKHRENLSKALSGKNHPMWGKKHSEESKRKMSEKASKRKLSEERKIKISLFHKGRKHTEETKRKMSELATGKVWDIKRREAFSGKNHHHWLGGKREYPLTFNNQLKDRIRVRDNFICQKCGVPELESGRKLSIHHIDYDKKNNNIDNLIGLCVSCHCKTNFNRDNWIILFNEVINSQKEVNNICGKCHEGIML